MKKSHQPVLWITVLKLTRIACGLALFFSCATAKADPQEATLQFGAPIADHAVFQQGIALPVWGNANPGATIEAAFAGQSKSTTTNAVGHWRITLDPLLAVKLQSVNDAPEAHTLKINSTLNGEKVVRELRDVVIGDVWLCAGQSNIADQHPQEVQRMLKEIAAWRESVKASFARKDYLR